MRLDEAELIRWGARIGQEITTPAFLGLTGTLGAGKSVLARAIGRGAGVRDSMPSPSFNLLFRYPAGEREVVHLDLYRLESSDEVWELGWDQLGTDDAIVLVEWPERAEAQLPENRWMIELLVPSDAPEQRDVSVRRFGSPPVLPGFPMSLSAR